MNNITIELCKEDRVRLDRIAELLEAQTAGKVNPTENEPENKPTAPEKAEAQASAQPVKGEAKQPEKAAPVADPVQAFIAWDVSPEPTVQDEPTVQLADIQNLVISLATKGKKAEVREIITDYAERVTLIPADQYGAVYKRLKKLEA